MSPFSTRGTNTWTLCQGQPLKGQASRARRSQDGDEGDSVGPLARLIRLGFQHRLAEEVIPRSVLGGGSALLAGYPGRPRGHQPGDEAFGVENQTGRIDLIP